MKRPVILTNWDFYLEEEAYTGEFYELFAAFVCSRKKRKRIPAEYAVTLRGDVYGKDDTFVHTLPIVVIKRVKTKSLRNAGKIWSDAKITSRAYCAKTKDGSEYFFRMRDALLSVASRVEYISN